MKAFKGRVHPYVFCGVGIPALKYYIKETTMNIRTVFAYGIRNLCLVCVFSVLVCSCMNDARKDAENVYATGVVLIRNTGYYTVKLDNGMAFYFSGFSDDGKLENLVADEDSVKGYEFYGTGFFVSADGKIATNAHVVTPPVSYDDVKGNLNAVLDEMRDDMMNEYEDYKRQAEEVKQESLKKIMSGSDYSVERELYSMIQERMARCLKLYDELESITVSDIEITQTYSIGVAYNGTYAESDSDFYDCNLIAESEDVDLALLQLEDKNTPKGRYIFNVVDGDPLSDYTLFEKVSRFVGDDKNSELLMIGFNLGPVLAQTSQGLKAQVTTGAVSQEDDNRLLYTIPALHGSSGSPVVNRKGELVGVNFAGLDMTQNFNYGIKVRRLYDLMKKVDRTTGLNEGDGGSSAKE